MAIDVSKITDSRRQQRENTSSEHRGTQALEQIADTLEALRQEFALFNNTVPRLMQQK